MSTAQQFAIIVPPQVKARYSNFLGVQHTPNEITVDFAMATVGSNEVEIHTRIVTTPVGVKQMAEALIERIRIYEAEFGDIVIPGTPDETKMKRGPIPPQKN